MNKFLGRFLLVGGGILLLSPFFVLRSLLYPFVLGKATIIQIAVALLFPFLVLIIFSFRKSFFEKKHLLTWSIVIYAAVLILTAATGIYPRQSFWGTADRSLGVFNLLHLLATYFIFLIVLKEAKARKHLILFAVAVGLAVSILGIFEYFGTNGSRVTGLFGNPILFAGYLLFPLFLSLIFVVRGILRKRLVFLAIFITIFASLLFAQSRGALAGAILGGVTAIVVIVWSHAGKRKTIFLKIAGIIAVAAILIFILAKSGNHTAISLTNRFTRLSLEDASGDQRLRLYAVALKAAGDRPIFGWGPENFDYAFDRNYDPALLKYGVSETWVDRSHNTYLDTLVMSGILGFAAYAAIFIAAFIMLRRSVTLGARDAREAGVLGALIVAYGVANFFAFDSPPSFIYFMFVLAYISAPIIKYEDKNIEFKTSKVYVVLAVAVLFFLMSMLFTLRNARAAFGMLRFTAIPSLAVGERLREIDYITKINPPLLHDFRLRFANSAFEEAGNLPISDAEITLSRAAEEMEKSVKEASGDFSYRFALGNLYLERGLLLGAENLDKAEKIFNSAEPLSPKRQSLFFQLASVEYLKHDFAKAVSILERVVSFDPEMGQAHWRLGIAYAYNGELDKALESWRRALYAKDGGGVKYVFIKNDLSAYHLNYAPTILKELNFASNIALQEVDYELLRALTLISIVMEGKNIERYGKLAAIELKLGNFSAARLVAQNIIEIDGSARPEAAAFLSEIEKQEAASK